MNNTEVINIRKSDLFIINQLFEIEKKVEKVSQASAIIRNINNIKYFFEHEAIGNGEGLVYHNPLGEKYNETRTDCEANIAGAGYSDLEIIEVIRPIIYYKQSNHKIVVQKAIVVVQSKNKG